MAFCHLKELLPLERATASVKLPEATAKITGQEKNPNCTRNYRKARGLLIGYRKLLLTFALEAKGAVSLDSKFRTALFLPQLQHSLNPIHTPGFPDPEAPDKQEADRQPAFCMESGSDALNRHTKVLASRAPLTSALFRFKGNK